MTILPKAFTVLVDSFNKIAGVGPRTAERYAYYLLKSDPSKARAISDALDNLHTSIKVCPKTFALIDDDVGVSPLYSDPKRDKKTIAVVAEPFDIVAMEKTNLFKGTYHVLGGLISPIDGIEPEHLRIRELIQRVSDDSVEEIILATNASIEGETTALYIQSLLKERTVKITRLARGLPIGVDLEYADQITLARGIRRKAGILMYNENLKNSVEEFLNNKKKVVIVQGDNPDADSLASSLALESILESLGIEAYMYCSIDVAHHLRYLPGWDRVSQELPSQFDGWILVDCEYTRLLDNVQSAGLLPLLKTTPLMVIDHHDSPTDIDFASLIINDPNSGATGEVIFNIARLCGWEVTKQSAEFLTVSILADTLGFTSEFLNGRSGPLHTVAELVDRGVSLSELNERRIKQFQITPDIFRYKAELMQRVQFHHDNTIATIDIPHDEIKEYSMDYNPTIVLDETRMIEGLAVTIGFKSYERNGSIYRITGRVRCGFGYRIARDLASHFKDGGGHIYAAGFKIAGDNLNLEEIKREAIQKAYELIKEADSEA
jgi:recombination protein RecR